MKKLMKVFVLASLCVACSDFFPGGKSANEDARPGLSGGLPDKAELDEKACDYGRLDSSDLRQQFVWTLSTQWICPKVSEFRYYVTLLRLSSRLSCTENAPSGIEKDVDRNWYGAIQAYERLAANPFGPMHAESNKLGMEIYSWPNYNRFALNAEYLKAVDQGDNYVMHLAPSRKGFSAIESLIFNRQATLKPGLSGKLRADEVAFNALGESERRKARCTVLKSMVNDVALHTEELYSAWASGAGAYPRQLAARMKSNETQMILNEISDGMIYVEKLKDYKIGLPLGLNTRCREQKCPDDVEHALSGAGVESLRANLDGLRAGFEGFKGPGFKDLLSAVGRGPLAQQMSIWLEQMDASIKEIEAQGPLRDQVASTDKTICIDASSPSAVCRLYFQSAGFLALFKADFMSALNLQPPRTDADND